MKNKLLKNQTVLKLSLLLIITAFSGGLLFLFFLPLNQTSLAQTENPDKVIIYPYNTTAGDNFRYWLNVSWCGEEGNSQVCYNQRPGQTNEVYHTRGGQATPGETDGTLTYAQTGMAWFTDSAPDCCYATAPEPGHNWQDIDDETRNHPIISTTWVQQRIKIPAGITKITDVKFYKIYIYQPGEAVGIKLKIIRASDGVEVYESSEGFLTESWGGYNYIDWGNPNHIAEPGESWRYDFSETTEGGVPVEAGEYYNIRLETTNGTNIGLPAASPCGANCQWWIDRGGSVVWIQEPNEDRPHSGTDLYPDGYAESGSAYFDTGLSRVNDIQKADIARMVVLGVSELRNDAACSSISVPEGFVYVGEEFLASVEMENTGTTTWTVANNYNLGSQDDQDNTIWGSNRVDYSNAATYPVSTGQSVIYTFPVTAPGTTGDYNFNWQMIQDGVEWFGQKCTSTITVIAPPTGSITGPTSGYVGSPFSYTASLTAGSGSSLTKGQIYAAPKNADGTPGAWTLLREETTNPSSFSTTWTPAAAGTYYIAINGYGQTYDTVQEKCSGDPNPSGLPSGWVYCDRTNTPHVNDYITVAVSVNPPTITSLQIGQKPGTTSTLSDGKYKYSGKQTTEGGSDWLNPIRVKLNATPGTGATTTQYYAAFYTGTQLTNKNTFLTDIQTKVNDPANGFLLAEYSAKQWVWNPRKNSCAGGWEDLTDAPDEYFEIYSCSGTKYYRAEPTATTMQWNVYFYKDVGSKTFKTAGYGTTNNNAAISDLKGEMSPTAP